MIPKIIHQIWIQGYDEIPENLKAYHNNCKVINHQFKHIFWDEDKIRDLLLEHFGEEYWELYQKYQVYAQKSDFARYAILCVHGGIYVDMDMICRKSLEPLLEHNFFCTSEIFYYVYKRYLNGVIGAIPNHPVFKFIFDYIFQRQYSHNNVTYSTGTSLLHDAVQKYRATTGKDDIKIIKSKYLHPCQIYDDDLCPYTCRDCYVAHANMGSWNSPTIKFLNKHVVKNLKIIVLMLIVIILLFIIYKSP